MSVYMCVNGCIGDNARTIKPTKGGQQRRAKPVSVQAEVGYTATVEDEDPALCIHGAGDW